MKNNPLVQKNLMVILCMTILLPNYQANATTSRQDNRISDNSSELSISNEIVQQDITVPTKVDSVPVSKAVYDTEITQRIAKIYALSLQRTNLKGPKSSLTLTKEREDLTEEEIEKLALAGAGIEDIYWINLIYKESALSTTDILDIKKNGDQPWEDIVMKIRGNGLGLMTSVEDSVYQDLIEKEYVDNQLSVTDSVYEDSMLEDQVIRSILSQELSTFASNVNSVINGLITQQLINQTNKQQYSDRSSSSELIDPASGSLTWKESEISLPGRDGLDLNIGVMYNSNQSYAHMKNYEAIGNIKKYNYLISRYDLGMGWSFQFPSVQLADGYMYYHNGQGAIYRVDFNSSDVLSNYTHLEGYQGKDVQFLQDSGTFSNGQVNSAYYLQYSDKKREYFASDGRLLGIVDRFGNTIKYEHMDRLTYDGQINKVISVITDSIGRTINFGYESNLNTTDTDTFTGEKIVVSVHNINGVESQKVIFKKWGSKVTNVNGNPDGYVPVLVRISDQIDQVTDFTYTAGSAKFHYDYKVINGYSGSTGFLSLTNVRYPNSTSNYQYDLVTRNLGASGFGQDFRVISRNDVMQTTFNQTQYAYVGDYTGYPTYYDPNNLPGTYNFSSSSTLLSNSATNGLVTTSYFNGLQQNISSTSQSSSGERKEERNTAFHPTFKYLPTLITSFDFGVGDNDSSANTLYSEVSYSDWGEVQSQTQPLTLNQFNDPNTKSKYTMSLTYEPNYHFIKSKSWFQNDSTYVTENYEYYDNGRIKTYTNPKSELTTYTYESVADDVRKVSNVIEEKTMQNDLVSKVTTTYGPESNYGYPTKQTSDFTNISVSGQRTSSIIQSQQAYDMGSGRLIEETDTNGKKTKYTYDLLGRVKTVTYPTITNLNGEQYDVEDLYTYTRVYANTNFDPENQGIIYLMVNSKRKYTQKSNGTITYLSNQNAYYDGLGLLRLEQSFDNGAITQYHVDDLSRVIYVMDTIGNVTTVNYNTWGEQNEALDAYGNLYINEHNLKLRKVTNFFVASSEVAAYRANSNNSTLKSNYVEQTYDQWDQLVSNMAYKDWPSQSQPITELYSYDIVGNLIVYTDPNKKLNNEGVTTKYTYDVLNRLNSIKNALGQITNYQYDRNGQITNTTIQNSISGTAVSLKSKMYNELGLLYSKKDAVSLSESQTYNQLGLLEQKIDRSGTVLNYQYDERDQGVSKLLTGVGGNTQQIKSIFGSNGIKIDTNELYLNGTKTASQTSTINVLKQLSSLSSEATGYSTSTEYKYDSANRVFTLMIRHSGIGYFDINYLYSKQHLDKVQTDGHPYYFNSAATASASYEYFPTGQVKRITYPTLADGSVLKTEYTYDGLNRLWTMQNKKGSGVLSSYTYLYDNNGNITSVTETLNNGAGKTTSYGYDAINRLTSITHPDGGGNTSYTYDLQGNRQTVSDTSINLLEYVNTSYTYDLENTLIGSIKDNILTSIKYLPNGLRYEKMTGTVKTQYNYNGNGEVVSESKSDGQKAIYIRGDRLLVKKDRTTEKDYYYLYNGHGDVVQIVDTNGTVVNSYAYDVWGSITNQTEGITNSFKYAGEIYDEDTGLYYLRARYYDPSVGRFINEDTYEGEITNPLSQNLYTYVHNNPLLYTDPTGRWCTSTNGKWSHAGACSSSTSTWSPDYDHIGYREKRNGKFIGTGLEKQDLAVDDKYVLFVRGDNDVYLGSSRDDQIQMRSWVLESYMTFQIKNHFPDLEAGFAYDFFGLSDPNQALILGMKNSTTLWEIKTGASNKIDYNINNSKVSAYQDPKTELYWARDTEGHGGSAYKVFRKVSGELRWVADADEYGNYMPKKHKGSIGMRIKIK
jgi:RHS repeat-associated protein